MVSHAPKARRIFFSLAGHMSPFPVTRYRKVFCVQSVLFSNRKQGGRRDTERAINACNGQEQKWKDTLGQRFPDFYCSHFFSEICFFREKERKICWFEIHA